eukprot:224221-Rhodomonas_salina.1
MFTMYANCLTINRQRQRHRSRAQINPPPAYSVSITLPPSSAAGLGFARHVQHHDGKSDEQRELKDKLVSVVKTRIIMIIIFVGGSSLSNAHRQAATVV